MRDSFIFYRSFFESINELDNDDKLALFEGICSYALDNKKPSLKGPAKAVFLLIQPQIDANTRKYENGCKGGRPANKKPKRNQTKTKPKRNDNDNDNDSYSDANAFGSFNNVMLFSDERASLTDTFERSDELINKVSAWLTNAKNDVPDHYALCLTFAANENWPKRKVIEPVRPIEITDPLEPDEQRRKVAEMRATLNSVIKTV